MLFRLEYSLDNKELTFVGSITADNEEIVINKFFSAHPNGMIHKINDVEFDTDKHFLRSNRIVLSD